jgi:UDP-galactopyranose mutase
MNTFYQMWGLTTPEQVAAKIEEQKAEALEKMKAEGVTEPRNLEEQGLCLVGKDIFEKLIKEYTKQMREASRMLEFEYAAVLRDKIAKLQGEK